MEISERCIAQLEKEGLTSVYEWSDDPGTVYPEHQHLGKVTIFVTDGSMDFTLAGVTYSLVTGDRIDIPPHIPHSAFVGSQGVQFVVGEEIVGDS